MPIIVNLCGSPGAGKSTGAAYVFSQLKMAGINAELVTEFAKDKVWEETHAPFENQMYMFAKQWFRITRCENKVDVIVTDSPIILSIIYQTDPRLGKEFDDLVMKIFKDYDNMNYFLHRVKPYNPVGRFQTAEESDELSKKIKDTFASFGLEFVDVDGDISGYSRIVADVKKRLGKENHDYNPRWEERWLGVIREDEDWDETYLLKLVVHKLMLMKDYFSGDKCIVEDTNEIVHDLEHAISLGERLIENKFNEKMFEVYENHAKHIRKNNVVHIVFDSPEGEEECRKASNAAEEDRIRVENEFWNTIRDNWRKWWD